MNDRHILLAKVDCGRLPIIGMRLWKSLQTPSLPNRTVQTVHQSQKYIARFIVALLNVLFQNGQHVGIAGSILLGGMLTGLVTPNT